MTFDYDDMNLVPKFFNGTSRSNLKTEAEFGGRVFENPVILANMKSVIDEELAIKLASNGYFYIMHRFDIDIVKFAKQMRDRGLIVSISLGVKEEDFKIAEELKKQDITIDYLTIDIAHGHSMMMKNAIKTYRDILGLEVYIIAGNVATLEAVYDLSDWGADCAKIGVGPGMVCTTALKTGFGTRGMQASTISDISKKSPISTIADGGVKYDCDVVKALVLGADMVMVGGMMTGHSDSPGEIIENDSKKYHKYYGSASKDNNKTNRIEGTSTYIEVKDTTVLERMTELNESIQSAMSYGDCETVDDFVHVRYIVKK